MHKPDKLLIRLGLTKLASEVEGVEKCKEVAILFIILATTDEDDENASTIAHKLSNIGSNLSMVISDPSACVLEIVMGLNAEKIMKENNEPNCEMVIQWYEIEMNCSRTI